LERFVGGNSGTDGDERERQQHGENAGAQAGKHPQSSIPDFERIPDRPSREALIFSLCLIAFSANATDVTRRKMIVTPKADEPVSSIGRNRVGLMAAATGIPPLA
jgi:hypothetical protein